MMAKKPSYEELQRQIGELEAAKLDQSAQYDALNNLFDLSLDMLCVADLNGHFRIINSAFETLLGYPRQLLLETPFIEFVHPDDRAATRQAMLLLAAGEALRYFENRYRCHNGSYKWLAWTCSRVTDEGFVYAVARDMTEQNATQKELGRQRDLLKQVLSNVPASIFWKDRHSVYLGVNDQFAAEAGFHSPDELVGKTDYELAWTKEQADFYRECDREVMDSGEPMLNIEESQLRADGQEVCLLTNKVPLLDASGTVYGLLGIYMDITHSKRAATALAISERRFRTIFNSSYQLIGVLDPDGMLLDANQTALDLGRLTKADVVGRPFWDTYWWRYSTAVQDRLKAAIRDASQGKPVSYEEEVLDGDGNIRTIEFTLKPVVDQSNQTLFIIPEGRDITDIKLAEEENQRHHNELAHVIRLSTAGEMASGMAHELNQPLTALLSYCGTAAELVKSMSPPPQQLATVLERATQQAHRASDIIRHLREFVSTGGNTRDSLDLDQLISDVIVFLKYETQASSVKIVFYPGCQACRVRASKIQIEQVLINMLRNSLEAIRTAKATEGQVVLRSRILPDDLAEVTVADNGPGIDPAIVTSIFHPFQTSKESGMGIGLSLSRTIIQNHGGKLWVDKDYQHGALFSFVLPLAGSARA